MINIDSYLEQLLLLMDSHFGPRLLYVGLQGSYLRGEATDSSDIDIMVILDTLSVNDLEVYRNLIRSLPAPDSLFPLRIVLLYFLIGAETVFKKYLEKLVSRCYFCYT